MPGEFTVVKDDLLAVSKHADASFENEDGWVLFWFNTPTKGKCLRVEYWRCDYPAVTVYITANWKAKRQVARYRKTMGERVF